ncbi:2OG-Fe(II) oxygenase [Hydrogenophaga sp. 5NK40-0174]|uniref:2OG-Fe(II) oxygenase n=1 Tax=Hydrogenophaga sp. 5NK40-0174 TaxID=3127649 RepID=UPI0031044BF5
MEQVSSTHELTSSYVFDDARYLNLAVENRQRYLNAEPYPHIYFDNFLPPAVAEAMLEEFPKPGKIDWTSYRRPAELKQVCADESQFGPVTRHMLHQFNSVPFLRFLEKLTGIEHLIPDPHMRGGGLHQTRRGGFLKLHADFSHHDQYFLDRRINVLLYLNKDWKDEYGGHFECWDKDTTKCYDKIAPVFNRLALFSTTSHSFHGHPDPLECPEEESRKSLALFYYTNGRPKGEAVGMHSTTWRGRPDERIATSGVSLAHDWLPPVMWRMARRTRDRFFPKTVVKKD